VSKWVDKQVIGLTGNIGSGKSVIRKMLEHLGAYGIDADVLSHRVISKGAPGYQPVVDMFGQWIVDFDGEINRKKLAQLVFSSPNALAVLETIVHPLITQALDLIIRHTQQKVIVIEAIKLIETPLYDCCDSIWVTCVAEDIQIERLMKNRGMSLDEIQKRLKAQSTQEQKSKYADVVIYNDGKYEETWAQVVKAWNILFFNTNFTHTEAAVARAHEPQDKVTIVRSKPSNALEIATLINQINSQESQKVDEGYVLEAFEDKAILLFKRGNKSVGLIAWQIENLVARTTHILIDHSIYVDEALPKLVSEMEKASIDLQCEAALVFVKDEMASYTSLWDLMGYQQKTPDELDVAIWQEAAREYMDKDLDCVLYFKQLRKDRVLQPI
jgi:dephospho-CoA kinase